MKKKHKRIRIPETYGATIIPVQPEREKRDPVFRELAVASRVIAGWEKPKRYKKRR